MSKDYTNRLSDEMFKRVYAQGSDRFPKNIFALYTTLSREGKTNELLIRGDGELITINKINPELVIDKLNLSEKLSAFSIESRNGKRKSIENPLYMPTGNKICFYKTEFLEEKLDKGKIVDTEVLVTDIILSRMAFSEQEARKYLK